jgi:hypothetical protein
VGTSLHKGRIGGSQISQSITNVESSAKSDDYRFLFMAKAYVMAWIEYATRPSCYNNIFRFYTCAFLQCLNVCIITNHAREELTGLSL